MAFRSHHVPQGVIKLKKKEFQDMKQGSMTVSEYVTRFTQLSHYAPNDVDTDEKKQECFLNELDDGLAYALEARDFENFQAMIDKALVLENRRGILSSKRKQERQSQQSTNSSPATTSILHLLDLSFAPSLRVFSRCLNLLNKAFLPPQWQMIPRPNLFQTPNTGNQSAPRTPTDHTSIQDPSRKKCYNCG
jgi:hypothetical protein